VEGTSGGNFHSNNKATTMRMQTPLADRRPIAYANFRFRLACAGEYWAGFSKVSGLASGQPEADHRAGPAPVLPRPIAGPGVVTAVTLERGVTYSEAFARWANTVWYHARAGAGITPGISPIELRRDLDLELCDEAGQRVMRYHLTRCWPTEFEASPELDGTGHAVVIERLVLQCEGWEQG